MPGGSLLAAVRPAITAIHMTTGEREWKSSQAWLAVLIVTSWCAQVMSGLGHGCLFTDGPWTTGQDGSETWTIAQALPRWALGPTIPPVRSSHPRRLLLFSPSILSRTLVPVFSLALQTQPSLSDRYPALHASSLHHAHLPARYRPRALPEAPSTLAPRLSRRPRQPATCAPRVP